jgi:serine/threonine protein kinase
MIGLEGRTLNDFSLRQLIGRGGMADVYLADDTHIGREVAIKVFKRDDDDMLRRFLREARLMASLHHPHLMPIYDAGTAVVDGVERYYITMPYMPAGTLRSTLRKSRPSLQQVSIYIHDIASALDYIHSQGIIHRDIKSSNILLDTKGNCYLSDFGIARNVSDATQMTSTGNVLGTVDYVAPELFEPDHKADARSDFYSLGVLLYEMVTGRLPFIGESQIAIVTMHVGKQPPRPSIFVSDLSAPVERVLLKALSKDPAQRYPTAIALADAFSRAIRAPYQAITSQDREASIMQQPAKPARTPREKSPLILPAPTTDTPQPHLAPLDEATIGFRQPASSAQMPNPPQLSQYRPPSSPQKRGRIVALIAILALLAISIPAVSLALYPHLFATTTPATSTPTVQNQQPTATPTMAPTATPNMTATAHALSLTATAQALHATATAIAGITATAQAQVAATAGVIQTATALSPTYTDLLNNANNPITLNEQWDSDTHNCVFRPDGYHVITGLISIKGCREKRVPYINSTISVDMTLASGTTGGIFFHVNTDFANDYAGYLFEVDTQGNYRLSRSDDYTTSYMTQDVLLKSGKVPSGWKPGLHVKNTLQLIIHDGVINFYTNTIYLNSVTDTTYTEGTFGFASSKNSDQSPGEAIYSNLRIYP